MCAGITGHRRTLLPLVFVLGLFLPAASPFGAYAAGSAPGPGSGQSPPLGHYGCYSAPIRTPFGSGYGNSIYHNRQREGDVWIINNHQYAGPNDKADVGTYVMDGRTLVAKSGAFAPPGPMTRITFTPAHGNDPASLYILSLDSKNNPTRGTECVWSDPLP